jgi:hypothetical protein
MTTSPAEVAGKTEPLSCGSCADFEWNGTRYGGRCRGPSRWNGIILSCLKDDESVQRCHSAVRSILTEKTNG